MHQCPSQKPVFPNKYCLIALSLIRSSNLTMPPKRLSLALSIFWMQFITSGFSLSACILFLVHASQLIGHSHQRPVANGPHDGVLDEAGSLGPGILTAHLRILVAGDRDVEDQPA